MQAGGLEESAWRKACDCLCNVIVIMVGRGIAVVQRTAPAISPCGSFCGYSSRWSIPTCRCSRAENVSLMTL